MASVIGYLALLAGAFALRFASGRWRAIDLLGQEGYSPASPTSSSSSS
jgi:hypothetical protein